MTAMASDTPGAGSGSAPASAAAPAIEMVSVVSGADLDAVRTLFHEYADALQLDLGFQDFEGELAALPGVYAAPGGTLLMARVGGQAAGCGALRALPDCDYPNACEMKRLYVRRAFRRFGVGRLLARQLMDAATQAGYSSMLLDTLDEMETARGLYATLGFEEIPPYYFNPIAGAHYLMAPLNAPQTRG